jgi:hypothetical protein
MISADETTTQSISASISSIATNEYSITSTSPIRPYVWLYLTQSHHDTKPTPPLMYLTPVGSHPKATLVLLASTPLWPNRPP